MFKYYINAEDKNVGTRIFMAGPEGVLCTNDNGIIKPATSEEVYNAFMSGTMAVTSNDNGSLYVTRAIKIKTVESEDGAAPIVTEVNIDGTVLTVNPDAGIDTSNPLNLNDPPQI